MARAASLRRKCRLQKARSEFQSVVECALKCTAEPLRLRLPAEGCIQRTNKYTSTTWLVVYSKAPLPTRPYLRLRFSQDSYIAVRAVPVVLEVLVSVVMWQVSHHAVSNRSNSTLSTCSSSVAKSVAGRSRTLTEEGCGK